MWTRLDALDYSSLILNASPNVKNFASLSSSLESQNLSDLWNESEISEKETNISHNFYH